MAFLVSISSQFPSALNNTYVKMAYFEVAYSATFHLTENKYQSRKQTHIKNSNRENLILEISQSGLGELKMQKGNTEVSQRQQLQEATTTSQV